LIPAAALLFFAASPPALDDDDEGDDDGGNGTSVEAKLNPPASQPAPNAFGNVVLTKDSNGEGDDNDEDGDCGCSDNEQMFMVLAHKLPDSFPPNPFEVWLENGVSTNSFFEVGVMSHKCGSNGVWKLKLKAKGGAPKALGVDDIDDLGGRVVEVRATGGGAVYLTGTIPPSKKIDCPGVSPVRRGRMKLTRPNTSSDPNAHGMVRIEHHGKTQTLELIAKSLDAAAAPFVAELETGIGTGTFSNIGMLEPKPASPGRFEIRLEHECGPPPVLHVPGVEQLPGRHVRVRDHSGHTVLHAILPPVHTPQETHNAHGKAQLSIPFNGPSPKATGDIRVKFNDPQGESRFDLRVKHLPKGGTYSLFVETSVASGVFEKVGPIHCKGIGLGGKTNGELGVNTNDGCPLPLEAPTVVDLKDRLIQVRDGMNVIHLVGQVP
jgi:hypothetical protein